MADDLVKVWLPLPETAPGPFETVWAAPGDPGEFELRNIPVFAHGVSLHDVVSAAPDQDGALVATDVIRRGGHSTVQILVRPEAPETSGEELVRSLEALGCGIESHSARYFAATVPPTADGDLVIAMLESALSSATVWYEIVSGDLGRVA